MFCRNLIRRVTFIEATQIVSSASPSLTQILDVLHHHGAENKAIAARALPHLTNLDQSDADSLAVASGHGLNDILLVMSRHKDSIEIREHCCRSVANISMLSANSVREQTTSGSVGEGKQSSSSYADILVEGNAVEMCLGVLSEGGSLSPKGRCWASMAILNLVMLTRDGAQRCAAHDGEEILSAFLEALCSQRNALLQQSTGGSDDLHHYLKLAANSTLGALVRLLTLEAPDNAKGIQFRYQMISSLALDAVVKAMSTFGVFPAGVDSDSCDAETCMIVHKCWEALQLASSYAKNLGLVYDALHDGRQVAEFIRSAQIASSRARVQALQAAGEEAGELHSVALKTYSCFIATMTELTATRHDLKDKATSTTTPKSADDVSQLDGDVDGGPSAVLPTESAIAVVDSIHAGMVSSYTSSYLVERITALEECMDDVRQSNQRAGDTIPEALMRRIQQHVVEATKLMSLLTNMAETDPFVSSANGVTLMLRTLRLLGVRSSLNAKLALLRVVGQTFSAAWNVANQNSGRESLRVLGFTDAVKAIVDGAKENIAALEGDSDDTRESGATADNSSALSMASKLVSIGEKLLEKLDATVVNPTYTHTAVTGVGKRKVL